MQLPTRIFGYYFDIRYNGVPINRDLVLDVDGHRCLLPSGFVIADDQAGITGMKVTEPELRRARLLDTLVHGPRSDFKRYSKSANIQVVRSMSGAMILRDSGRVQPMIRMGGGRVNGNG